MHCGGPRQRREGEVAGLQMQHVRTGGALIGQEGRRRQVQTCRRGQSCGLTRSKSDTVMRFFPLGFFADLGLRLAAVWESGDDRRLVASTWIDPRRFQKPRWLDADHPHTATPRAIFFHWETEGV